MLNKCGIRTIGPLNESSIMTNVQNQTHLTLFPNGTVVYLLLESKQHNSFTMADVQTDKRILFLLQN